MNKKPVKKTDSVPSDPEVPQIFAVQINAGKASFTRRDFLAAAGIAATAAALSGCEVADTPEANPTMMPTETIPPKNTPTPYLTATPAPTLAPKLVDKCGVARAHTGRVDRLAISMDSSLLASSGDKTIKVWLLPNGALLLTLKHGEILPIRNLLISPDNKYLVSVSSLIKVWSLPDGVLRYTLDETSIAMAISPDGSTLAIGSGDKIELWSLSDGKLLNTLGPTGVYAFDLLFSPDGASLIVIDRDEIGVLSYPDGALIQKLAGEGENRDTTINLDGSRLAVDKGKGNRVQIWSLPEGTLLQTIEIDTDSYSKPTISPDGSLLVVGSGLNNQKIELWSLPEGKRIRSLMHSLEGHTSLATSPDSTLLVSGGSDGTIRLWSLPYGEPISCPIDLAINTTKVEGVSYEITNDQGGVRTITLPCGSPIPAGAVCTCNCVAGGMCSCVGHSCTCDTHSTGVHYWYPN